MKPAARTPKASAYDFEFDLKRMKMLEFGALIKTFLFPGRQLRLGLSRSSSGVVHVLVSHKPKGQAEIISAGPGIPALARLLVPATACGDLDNTPVYLKSAPLGQQDPEAWIDHHELDVIPQGTATETVVNEYSVHKGTIYSATVTKDALKKAAQCPDTAIFYAFLSTPLWNLGRLYGQTITTPFVLWRLSKNGSVFGLVRNGRCEKIVHSWIGTDDIGPDTIKDINDTIGFLCNGETIKNVYLFSPDKSFKMLEGFKIPAYELNKVPNSFGGLPLYCHEAYSNACFGPDGDHNFVPFAEFQKTRKLESQAVKLMILIRFGLWLFIGSFALLGGIDFGLRAIDTKYRSPMEALQSQELIVKAAEKRHAVLMKQVGAKAKFATERSRVTGLLADLQTVFPEDAWAENITIADLDKNTFQCDIQAFAHVSRKVSDVLDAVRSLKGITDARLVYSEQVVMPDKSKVIRFKITCEWK